MLRAYLDEFVATAGYECDVTSGPVALDGSRVISPTLRESRDRAITIAKADQRWKERLLSLMDDPSLAALAGFPTVDAVLENSDNGYATVLPMIKAWQVAEHIGAISALQFREICKQQVVLIEALTTRIASAQPLSDRLALYRAGADGHQTLGRLMPKSIIFPSSV
jgi:hypothetical protein